MMRYALILLAACGNPIEETRVVLKISSVDARLRPMYDALRIDVERLAGYDVLPLVDGDGITLVVDNDRCVQKTREEWDADVKTIFVLGFWSRKTSEIVLVEPGANLQFHPTLNINYRPDLQIYPVVLAHEIGHALGLPHSESGLMRDAINVDACAGNEARCLLDALQIPILEN